MTTLQSGAALSMSRVVIGPSRSTVVVIELSHIDGAETSVSRCSFDRLNTVFEAIHVPLQPPELRECRAAGRVRRLNVE